MTFVRANPLGWAPFELLLSTQMNVIDSQIPFALDGNAGGVYTPTAGLVLDSVVFGAPGILMNLKAPDQSNTFPVLQIDNDQNSNGLLILAPNPFDDAGSLNTQILAIGQANSNAASGTGGTGITAAGGSIAAPGTSTGDGGTGGIFTGGAGGAAGDGGVGAVIAGGDGDEGGVGLVVDGGGGTGPGASAILAIGGGGATGGGPGLQASGGIGPTTAPAIVALVGVAPTLSGVPAIIAVGETGDDVVSVGGPGIDARGGLTTSLVNGDFGGVGVIGVGGTALEATSQAAGGRGATLVGGQGESATGTGGLGADITGGTGFNGGVGLEVTAGPASGGISGTAIVANGAGVGASILAGASPTSSGLATIVALNLAGSGDGHAMLASLSGGEGAAISLNAAANGAHILFANSLAVPTSLTDGMLWFNGSDLLVRIGGTTFTLDKT